MQELHVLPFIKITSKVKTWLPTKANQKILNSKAMHKYCLQNILDNTDTWSAIQRIGYYEQV